MKFVLLVSLLVFSGCSNQNLDIELLQTIEINENCDKTNCITTVGKDNVIVDSNFSIYRYITPLECERLQNVPDKFTSIVSNSQRYKLLGNGWTIDIIAWIFSFMDLK